MNRLKLEIEPHDLHQFPSNSECDTKIFKTTAHQLQPARNSEFFFFGGDLCNETNGNLAVKDSRGRLCWSMFHSRLSFKELSESTTRKFIFEVHGNVRRRWC